MGKILFPPLKLLNFISQFPYIRRRIPQRSPLNTFPHSQISIKNFIKHIPCITKKTQNPRILCDKDSWVLIKIETLRGFEGFWNVGVWFLGLRKRWRDDWCKECLAFEIWRQILCKRCEY